MVEIAAVGIDAAALSTREINALIRTGLQGGAAEISVKNPNARHNLGGRSAATGTSAFSG